MEWKYERDNEIEMNCDICQARANKLECVKCSPQATEMYKDLVDVYCKECEEQESENGSVEVPEEAHVAGKSNQDPIVVD
jgi:hypothetical protein